MRPIRHCKYCSAPFEATAPHSAYCSTKCCDRYNNEKWRREHPHPLEHQIWRSMKKRCKCPTNKDYPKYGARGIAVCERWESFDNFMADMGPRPSPSHSVERIDNDGNYEPSNCKWGTKIEQSRNRCTSWTPEQDAKLAEGLAAGLKYEDMAPLIGRSKEGISRRVGFLNLKSRRGPGGILLPPFAISSQDDHRVVD